MKGSLLKIIHPFLLILLFGTLSFGQKTDKVYLKNGDVITGEIKSMKLAMLSFKMDGPGTISIKWEEVVGFKSDKVFEIQLRWGEIVVTRVDSSFYVSRHATINDIVEIIPIKDKFLARLIGDFNLGFNYSKSSEVLQFNLYTDITYKIPRWEFGIKYNAIITAQTSDTTVSEKQDLVLAFMKELDKKLFFGAGIAWQRNSELGLKNRFLVNGLVGLNTISNNHNRMLVSTGLSVNMEQSVESATYTTNLDALAVIAYKRFYYSAPKLSIDASYSIYPSLSNWGRVRMDLSLYVMVEVFKDFTIGLTFYDTYDSKPPEGATSGNDYGVNFTIGYIFGK